MQFSGKWTPPTRRNMTLPCSGLVFTSNSESRTVSCKRSQLRRPVRRKPVHSLCHKSPHSLCDQPVLYPDGPVRHGCQLRIMGHDDEGVPEGVAQPEEEVVKLLFVLSVEVT